MFDNDLIIVEVPDCTHSNSGVAHAEGAGLTSGYTAVLELDGLALPLVDTLCLVMTVEKAAAQDLYATLEFSVDGSTYRELVRVTMPAGGKGQVSGQFGQHLTMFRRTAANVQCKVYIGCGSTSAVLDFDRVMVAISNGEPSISGMKPDQTLLA